MNVLEFSFKSPMKSLTLIQTLQSTQMTSNQTSKMTPENHAILDRIQRIGNERTLTRAVQMNDEIFKETGSRYALDQFINCIANKGIIPVDGSIVIPGCELETVNLFKRDPIFLMSIKLEDKAPSSTS